MPRRMPGIRHTKALDRDVGVTGSSHFAHDDAKVVLTSPRQTIDRYPAKKSKSQPLSAWVTRSA
jgi:hypothetical protein